MAINREVLGPLKTFTITSGTARETLLGTPETLPTTEPGTGQFSYTIQQSDLPTISPSVPMKYNAFVVVSGKAGATAAAISYRVLKNGISQATAQVGTTNGTANQFWCHTHWRTSDVVVGDVIEVKYWSSTSDAYYDFRGLVVAPTQPDCSKRGTVLRDLKWSTVLSSLNPFTTGFTVANAAASAVFPSTTSSVSINVATNTPWGTVLPWTTYGLFKNSQGDNNSTTYVGSSNATARNMQKMLFPTLFSYREVIGV